MNTFSTGAVAHFGLPINFTRRKKNPETGEWEGESFIIDVSVFNRDMVKLADMVMQYLKKGSQVYVEGRLKPNEYTDKNGVKVFKPVLTADVIEFLDRPTETGGGGGEAGMRSAAPSRPTSGYGGAPPARKPAPGFSDDQYDEQEPPAPQGGPPENDIPF